jgi:hypothetical protein
MPDTPERENLPPSEHVQNEDLPPLATKIRFEARYRSVPRGRQDVSLAIFLGLLLLIGIAGYQGFASISAFLDLTKRSLALRAKHKPAPEPTPEVEFFYEPNSSREPSISREPGK